MNARSGLMESCLAAPARRGAGIGVGARSMVVASVLAVVTLGGCAPSDESASAGESASDRDAALPLLVLPGLAGLETGVQDQIRARHAAVLALAGGAGSATETLGDAYGELGMLLQAAGFYRAAEDAYLNAQARVPGLDPLAVLPRPSLPVDRGARTGGGAFPAGPGAGARQPAGAGLAGRDASRSGTAGRSRAGVGPGAGSAAGVAGGPGRDRARGARARGRGAGRHLPGTRAGRRSRGDEPPLQPRNGLPRAGALGAGGAVSAGAGQRSAGASRPAPAAVDRAAR